MSDILYKMVEIPNTNYTISETGIVTNTKTGKVRRPQIHGDGYSRMQLTRIDGTIWCCYVHRLVAEAYCKKTEGLKEVNHIDGNKSNNHFENLEWCTARHNQVHALKTGLAKSGINNYKSKFTLDDIARIKELYNEGVKQHIIAEEYSVVKSTISNVITGKRYRY